MLDQADPHDPALLRHQQNAVRIEIAVALIAFILFRLAHMHMRMAQFVIESPTRFARLIQANILHRRPINPAATSGQCTRSRSDPSHAPVGVTLDKNRAASRQSPRVLLHLLDSDHLAVSRGLIVNG